MLLGQWRKFMENKPQPTSGKGDKPRNCFSSNFKKNYDEINWGKSLKSKEQRPNKVTFEEKNHQI